MVAKQIGSFIVGIGAGSFVMDRSVPILGCRCRFHQCPQSLFQTTNVVVDQALFAEILGTSYANQSQHGVDFFEIQYLQQNRSKSIRRCWI